MNVSKCLGTRIRWEGKLVKTPSRNFDAIQYDLFRYIKYQKEVI